MYWILPVICSIRNILGILGIALAMADPGCGGSEGATGSDEPEAGSKQGGAESAPASDEDRARPPIVLNRNDPRFATVTGEGRHPKPVVHPSGGPPPKRFVVRDIKVGSGLLARPGDRVAVLYIGVDQQTGKVRFETWPPLETPLVVELGRNGNAEDWEEGVVGMQVGGRREMLIPSDPSLGSDALDYVFDLVRVESIPRASSG